MNRRPWWLLPPGRIHPAWWILPGLAIVWADVAFRPGSAFPSFYAVPVALAAWYSGRVPAVSLAVAIPACRLLALPWLSQSGAEWAASSVPTLIRGGVILVMALWFDRLALFERRLRDRVAALEGLLPICTFCKSIQNEAGSWEPLETYISRRSTAEFSHGMCPACGEKHYSDVLAGP